MRVALALHRLHVRSDMLHGLGFASTLGALALWGRSLTLEKDDERARSERLAIFVGLWPPTLFLLGKVLQDLEATPVEQAHRAHGREADRLDESLREQVRVS
jgi:hypothetical protein